MIKNLPEVPNTNDVPRLALSDAGEPGGNCITDISADELCVPQTTTLVELDTTSNPEVPAGGDLNAGASVMSISDQKTGKRKVVDDLDTPPQEIANISDDAQSSSKKQKRLAALDIETGTTKDIPFQEGSSGDKSIGPDNDLHSKNEDEPNAKTSGDETEDSVGNELIGVTEVHKLKQLRHSKEIQVSGVSSNTEWKQMEKELYIKGLEIFGRNR